MKKLKAYMVREDYEGHAVIAFATNNATARREGGQELNLEFDEVESCRRAPEFDQYAPGPVPALVMIEHGWWFECSHCGRKVSASDMYDEIEDQGLDPSQFAPRDDGRHGVYCSATCEAQHWAEGRARAHAKADLLEIFAAKFPDAQVESVHVYGSQLESSDANGGAKCSVTFKFPGAKYTSRWVFGEDKQVHVPTIDLEAFHAWRGATTNKEIYDRRSLLEQH